MTKNEPLKISFEAKVTRKTGTYDLKEFMHVKFEETVPVGVEPIKYLRQRLAEEIKRQAPNMVLENEQKAEEPDDLTVTEKGITLWPIFTKNSTLPK